MAFGIFLVRFECRQLGREPTVRFRCRNGAMETFGRRSVEVVIASDDAFQLSATTSCFLQSVQKDMR
jgi:hypothetical protein